MRRKARVDGSKSTGSLYLTLQLALREIIGQAKIDAARMIEGNPALMQLRLLQQLADSTGNTLVLGFPPSSTPLPVRAPEAEAVETKEIPPADEPV